MIYKIQVLPFRVTVEADSPTDAKVKAAMVCDEQGLLFDHMEVEDEEI